MDLYKFNSEKMAIKAELKVFCEKYAQVIVNYYLSDGFEELSKGMKLYTDWQKTIVFDFLILEQKAILECVKRNKQFFLKIITDGKGDMIRPMLGLKSSKYDQIWLEVLDLLNLYFVQKKVDDKLTNLSLEKFFENSILNPFKNDNQQG